MRVVFHSMFQKHLTLATLAALTGICEALYGIAVTRSSLGISGHFGNPAGFSAFLAALLPFALYFTGHRKKLLVASGIIASLIIFTAILLSRSRAGLVAASVVIIFGLWPRISPVWKRLSPPIKTTFWCHCAGYGGRDSALSSQERFSRRQIADLAQHGGDDRGQAAVRARSGRFPVKIYALPSRLFPDASGQSICVFSG